MPDWYTCIASLPELKHYPTGRSPFKLNKPSKVGENGGVPLVVPVLQNLARTWGKFRFFIVQHLPYDI